MMWRRLSSLRRQSERLPHKDAVLASLRRLLVS